MLLPNILLLPMIYVFSPHAQSNNWYVMISNEIVDQKYLLVSGKYAMAPKLGNICQI